MVVRSMCTVDVSTIILSKVLTTLFSFLSFFNLDNFYVFHWLGFDAFTQLYIFIFQLVIVIVIVIIIIWCFMICWWYWVFGFRVDFRFYRFQDGSCCLLFFFRLLAIFFLESVTFTCFSLPLSLQVLVESYLQFNFGHTISVQCI